MKHIWTVHGCLTARDRQWFTYAQRRCTYGSLTTRPRAPILVQVEKREGSNMTDKASRTNNWTRGSHEDEDPVGDSV
jgi:hypothetical protein